MRVALLLIAVLPPAAVQAQPTAEPAVLRGESPQTRKRLAEIEQKIIGGKAGEVAEDLQRILDEAADDLISLDGRHFRPARSLVHQLLAKLPPNSLKAYRDRIEEPARKLLDAARRDRDPRPLWQLLDRYFVSRPAEEALLLLGDLLFERGDFRLAEQVWKQLLPDANAEIVYPGAKTDPAAVRARIILAIHAQGETPRAKSELDAFEKLHAKATGPLGGTTVPYADILREWLARPLPGPTAGGRSWPAFGGSSAHSGLLSGPVPVRWPTRPSWVEPIPQDRGAGLRLPPARPPYGHPVIDDGWVYVSDGHEVHGFELATHTRRLVYPPFPRERDLRPGDPPSCPTLTAANGRLYARVGSLAIRPRDPQKAADSSIICLLPHARPAERVQWRLTPPMVDGKANGVWEGSPLVANGRLWAAFSRFEGGRVVFAVACYDPADADPDHVPERPVWVVDVCESPLLSTPELHVRGRMEILTLAGRNLVFNTNAGAVVALDAGTGRRAWGFQYPRLARRLVEANRSPDPAPAVLAGGRIFVAPADTDRVFAIDAETGRELWESGPVDGARILGVTRNRLIATSTGPVKGIRGLSVFNGSYRSPDGWIQTTGLLGFGQGFATESAILWPSRDGLYFLDPDTGEPIRTAPPLNTLNADDRGDLFGNLAYANGWLVVVTAREVWAYRTDAPPYEKPDDPRNRFTSLVDQQRFQEAARGDFPNALRAWAAARLLAPGAPEFPELRGEWLRTADGELATYGQLLDRLHEKQEPRRGTPGVPWSAANRTGLDAPDLAADAVVATTLRLPHQAVPLLPIRGAPPPRHLFLTTPEDVFVVSIHERTKTAFARAGVFTHAAELPSGFVLAGPLAVAVYGANREPIWVFRVPETEPLVPIAVRTELLPPEELSSFVLAGEWLFARLGERHLIALDLKAHVVAWVLGSHGSPCYEPLQYSTAPGFTPHFFVSDRSLAVQLTDGRRWFVQAATGRVWGDRSRSFDRVPVEFGQPTAAVAWPAPPVHLDNNLLALSDGPGLVRFTAVPSGKTKYSYQVLGESSLAGEPPQVHRIGELLFVAVRRNYGVELTRLDPATGKPEWREPAFLEVGAIDLAAADADPQRLFVPMGESLAALDLETGAVVWQVKLPTAARWTVRAGRSVAIACPAEAVPDDPPGEVWHRLRASFIREPQPWRLPWLAAALFESCTVRTVPVLLFDLETGKLRKMLTIPARGPAAVSVFAAGTATIATADRIVWLK